MGSFPKLLEGQESCWSVLQNRAGLEAWLSETPPRIKGRTAPGSSKFEAEGPLVHTSLLPFPRGA